jgi:hypothetical protein
MRSLVVYEETKSQVADRFFELVEEYRRSAEPFYGLSRQEAHLGRGQNLRQKTDSLKA